MTQDNDRVVVCSCTRDLNRSKFLWPRFVAPRCHAQCPLGSSCWRQLADAARDFADRLLRCVYASVLHFARGRGQDVCHHALWAETFISIARVLIRPTRRWWAGGRGGGGSCSASRGQASVAPQEVPQVSLEPVATPAPSAGIPVYSPSPGCDRSSKRRGSSRSRHNGHLCIREHFRLRFRCTPPPPPRRDFRMSMWGRGVGASDMGATVYFEGRMARVSQGDMKWAPRASAARREFVGTFAQEDRYWGPRDGGAGAEGTVDWQRLTSAGAGYARAARPRHWRVGHAGARVWIAGDARGDPSRL